MVQGLGFWVQGVGFRVESQGARLSVSSVGFRL